MRAGASARTETYLYVYIFLYIFAIVRNKHLSEKEQGDEDQTRIGVEDLRQGEFHSKRFVMGWGGGVLLNVLYSIGWTLLLKVLM